MNKIGHDWKIFKLLYLNTIPGTRWPAVRPELEKFRHFGTIVQVLGAFLWVNFAKYWSYCGKNALLLGKFSLLSMATYLKRIQSSGHTVMVCLHLTYLCKVTWLYKVFKLKFSKNIKGGEIIRPKFSHFRFAKDTKTVVLGN